MHVDSCPFCILSCHRSKISKSCCIFIPKYCFISANSADPGGMSHNCLPKYMLKCSAYALNNTRRCEFEHALLNSFPTSASAVNLKFANIWTQIRPDKLSGPIWIQTV